jgi:hypothetical protein
MIVFVAAGMSFQSRCLAIAEEYKFTVPLTLKERWNTRRQRLMREIPEICSVTVINLATFMEIISDIQIVIRIEK